MAIIKFAAVRLESNKYVNVVVKIDPIFFNCNFESVISPKTCDDFVSQRKYVISQCKCETLCPPTNKKCYKRGYIVTLGG